MGDARKFFHYSQPFAMRRGGSLAELTLAWESWGELSPARDNAVMLFTGLSPDAHAASNEANPEPGWWEFMVGPGKPIDTDRWFVICINTLGSCKGSTGPASIDPATGKPYGPDFPELSIEDIAEADELLLLSLGIEQVAVLVGPSMGGMTATAFALAHPHHGRHLVSLSACFSASPFATAVRSLQREAIHSDPDYRGGRYHGTPGPVNGMRIARKLGMISYRSAEEWRERFKRDRIPPERASGLPFAPEFEIESYLEHQAQSFITGFDPNCYLYLSRSMDWFDPADSGDLGSLTFDSALVIGVDTDILFPLYQQAEIADRLIANGVDTTFLELDSIQGHDAFLTDEAQFAPALEKYFKMVS